MNDHAEDDDKTQGEKSRVKQIKVRQMNGRRSEITQMGNWNGGMG